MSTWQTLKVCALYLTLSLDDDHRVLDTFIYFFDAFFILSSSVS
jgi:hypothetical protein